MLTDSKIKELDEMLPDFRRNLSSNLRLLRHREGMSQEEFGELLRMSRTSYNRIEKGRVFPDLLTVCIIHFAFDIPMEALLDRNLEDCIYCSNCSGHCGNGCDCAENKNHACRND